MSTLVFLDTGPLGMVTNPRATPQTERCTHWMEGLLARGVRVLIPEIADYELRRELRRAGKSQVPDALMPWWKLWSISH